MLSNARYPDLCLQSPRSWCQVGHINFGAESMKTGLALFALLAAATLLGGCSYINDGSWERCPYNQYFTTSPKYPAPERPWNYPCEGNRDAVVFRP